MFHLFKKESQSGGRRVEGKKERDFPNGLGQESGQDLEVSADMSKLEMSFTKGCPEPGGKAMGLGPEGQLLRAAAGAGPPKTKGISPALHVHMFSMKNPHRWVQEGQLTWSLGWLMASFKEEIGGFLYSLPFSPEFLSFSSSILFFWHH